jgi:hypothetical protein
LEITTRHKVIVVSKQPPFHPDLKDLKPQSQVTAQRPLGHLFFSFEIASSDFTLIKNSVGLDNGSIGFLIFPNCISPTSDSKLWLLRQRAQQDKNPDNLLPKPDGGILLSFFPDL